MLALPASTQQATGPVLIAVPLVFDRVTVIDVEQGRLIPNQRVVVTGNRVRAVGDAEAVTLPRRAQVVNAQGKYLIPGLWDMHLHHAWEALPHTTDYLPYLLLIANGVTGFRDASMDVPLDTAFRWRREILAGTRVGPPRQLLGGPRLVPTASCAGKPPAYMLCVTAGDTAAARRAVAALQAAGAEMLKIYSPSWPVYAAARRVGLPFGGHGAFSDGRSTTAIELSDSGASILDHSSALGIPCSAGVGNVEACREVAERFRRNGTWWVPTCVGVFVCGGPGAQAVAARFDTLMLRFAARAVRNPYTPDLTGRNAFHAAIPDAMSNAARSVVSAEPLFRLAQEAGVPILAGTDAMGASQLRQDSFAPYQFSGFTLHAELAIDVAEGLTPLTVLQSATLNPAKLLHATDSLGTVAPGKLADLVLLDANPLDDIANTTTIRAVVANGRYFDRVALDRLLAVFQTQARPAP